MSWLGSLANSLRLDDDDAENDTVPTNSKQHDNHNEETKPSSSPQQQQQQQNDDEEEDHEEELEEEEEEEEELQSRGVKEDLTELKQTLTRQLWGVASFLAPPPEPSQSEIGGDLAEIGGRFTEISKMASNYFLFGSEENEEYEEEEEEEGNSNSAAVGITDEVLAFARNIAMHPETWLDFPLDPEEDLDDFEMSDVQQEHALAIERLSPQLNALRIELCPCHMSEGYFWKVYFVLLHSRLNKHDAEILSSPQVMEARAMWMQELQKKTKPETDWYGRSTSYLKDSTNLVHEDLISSSNYAPFESMSPRTYASERTTSTMTTDYETEKYLVESTETQFVDKSVIEERPVSKTEDKDLLVGPSSKILIPNFEDDEDDWPDEDSELGGYSGRVICVGTDEDVSFSDLEDFDDGRVPMKSKIVSKGTT